MLDMNKVHYKRNKHLVRGLDYYNGTCFEIKTDEAAVNGILGQSQSTLIAGGRYDHLASIYTNGKINLPAIGWAAGIDRLALILEHVLSNQNVIITCVENFLRVLTIFCEVFDFRATYKIFYACYDDVLGI